MGDQGGAAVPPRAGVGPHRPGVKVTLVEPTGYTTDWRGASSVQAEHIAAYDALRERQAAAPSSVRARRGDPAATGRAMLELVDADDPPLRVFLGIGPLDIIRDEYARRIATWERWDDLSRMAHGEPERA